MGKADGGLRKVFQTFLPKPDWKWSPIETGGTHNGVPDSFFAHTKLKVNGWVECKATDGWAVKFEPHQLAWIPTHVAAGVSVWVAIYARGVGSGGGKGSALWLAAGHLADVISRTGLNGIPKESYEGIWYGAPRTWDWKKIGEILTSR